MTDYTKMTRQQLVPILAGYVTDYGRIEAADSAAHVQSWLKQFDFGDQDTILQETCYIFSRFYFKREHYAKYAAGLVHATSVFGSNIGATLQKTKFLQTTNTGKSQRTVFAFIDAEMKNKFSFDHTSCGIVAPARFLYVDDTIFTGRAAFKDIQSGLISANKGSHLDAIFFIAYSSGLDALKNQLKAFCVPRGITYEVRSFHEINDTGDELNRIAPTEACGRGVDCNYLRGLIQLHQGTVGMFRAPGTPKIETLFSSSQARLTVERAFLDKGADLLNSVMKIQKDTFPLGYGEEGTLGFGAMAFTFRNTPNNVPLVYWWGNPKMAPKLNGEPNPLSRWNPLLVRDTRYMS